jgi:hypothetical protein
LLRCTFYRCGSTIYTACFGGSSRRHLRILEWSLLAGITITIVLFVGGRLQVLFVSLSHTINIVILPFFLL